MSHQRLTEHTPIMIIIMIIAQVHMTNNDLCVDHIKSAQENGQVQEKEACKDILITMMIKLTNKQKGNQYILIFGLFCFSPGIFDNTDVNLVARLLENIKGRRPDVDDERFQLRGAEHFQSLQVG